MRPKIAVVGCGYWGKNLVRNFKELGALELICDTTSQGLEKANEIAPGVKTVQDFDDVLKSGVNGVVIATPAVTHFPLAEKALKAGKDVFVEKPLAVNYEEGAKLVELADAKQRMLMVGHVLEYHPGIKKLIDLIRDDTLGKIHYIYSNRLSLGKIRREENILWSFAPHDIAIILRIMGKMPFQVVVSGGSYVQPNIADVTITNLLFDNGVRAHIYVSWLHPFKEQRLVVIGSKRMATFDDVTKELLLFDQRVEVKEGEPIPIKGEGEIVEYASSEPLKMECQAFLDSISTRNQPLTNGHSGLQVLKVLQCAQRSLVLNGQQETLPIERRTESVVRVIEEEVSEAKAISKKNGNHQNGKKVVEVV